MSLLRLIVLCATLTTTAFFSTEAESRIPDNLSELDDTQLVEAARLVIPKEPTSSDLSALTRLQHEFSQRFYELDGFLKRDKIPGFDEVREQLETAARRALSKTDFETLRRLTLGNGKEDGGNWLLFDALRQRLIEKEVKRLVSEPKPKLKFPENPQPPPNVPSSGWFKDEDAQKAYFQACAPFDALMRKAAKKERGFHAENSAYSQLVDDFLKGKRDSVADDLLRFRWDSFCGTGMDEISEITGSIIFISLLRENRLTEAVGASFLVRNSPNWMREPNQPFDQWRIDFLTHCGVDWEAVMIGRGDVDFLAAHGSARAARALLRTINGSGSGDSYIYYDVVAAFLAPEGSKHASDLRNGLPKELQQELLNVLIGWVTPETAFVYLRRILDQLRQLRRPETKATLHSLLKHPSTPIAEQAASILRSMGEDIPPITPVPPARFQLFQNGAPYTNSKIDWHLDGGGLGNGGGSVRTDGSGCCTIASAEFYDPTQKRVSIEFFQWPGGRELDWGQQNYDEPWTRAKEAVTPAIDAGSRVDFATCALPIEVTYSRPVSEGKLPVVFHLYRLDGPDSVNENNCLAQNTGQVYWSLTPNNASLSKLTFSTISTGRYRLSILAPGSARWESGPFEVKPSMQPVLAKLSKGASVYAHFLMPKNGRASGEWKMFRDGADVTAEVASIQREYIEVYRKGLHFMCLPVGKYQIKVLSTKEGLAALGVTVPEGRIDSGIDCAGATVDFEINENTPYRIDLEKIILKPIEEQNAKIDWVER